MTDKELENGINRLVEIGLLIPFDEKLQLYHGRARDMRKEGAQEWIVDVFFDNSGTNTVNSGLIKTKNVNEIPALHVAGHEIADRFAFVRTRDKNYEAGIYDLSKTDLYKQETIRIVPFEKGKFFLNDKVKISELSREDKRIMREVLGISLSISAEYSTGFVPLDIGQDFNYNIVHFEFEKYKEHFLNIYKIGDLINTKRFVTNEEVENYSKESGLDKEKCNEIAGIINAAKLLYNDPILAVNYVVFGKDSKKIKENEMDFPISIEYILSWTKKNNIIGFNAEVSSFSLMQKISDFIIFDKDGVGSEKQYWLRENKKNMMSNLATELQLNQMTKDKNILENLAKDDSEQVVNFLINSNIKIKGENIEKYFNADSRVTEEFTVAEHTETVLRIFEESFKDEFPENLHPLIRLIILAHDAGKSLTRYFHDPKQKEFNQDVAQEMLLQMGINAKIRELILFIIGDSQRNASEYMVRRQKNGKIMLERECKEKLTSLGFSNDAMMVNALERICLILQYCDGAAYTVYAKTRDRKDKNSEFVYRNCNKNFSKSFKVSDMGKIVPVVEHENI